MLNKRALKALSEIMEYLDGEEVESMKGGLPDMEDEVKKGGAVAVLEMKKDEAPGDGDDDSDSTSKCPNCGFSTLGANYCPGCGQKLDASASGSGDM